MCARREKKSPFFLTPISLNLIILRIMSSFMILNSKLSTLVYNNNNNNNNLFNVLK